MGRFLSIRFDQLRYDLERPTDCSDGCEDVFDGMVGFDHGGELESIGSAVTRFILSLAG